MVRMLLDMSNYRYWSKYERSGHYFTGPITYTEWKRKVRERLCDHNAVYHSANLGEFEDHIDFETEEDLLIFKLKYG